MKIQQLAVIPDEVNCQDAATLPVAGLTALYGLESCSRLLGAKVVVTGARRCRLFRTPARGGNGCRVFAQVRASEHAAKFENIAVEQVGGQLERRRVGRTWTVPPDTRWRRRTGPMLGHLVQCLEANGRAVASGVSDSTTAEVAVRELMFTGSGRLEGFHRYRESEIVSAGSGLARLLQLMRDGKLRTLLSQVND